MLEGGEVECVIMVNFLRLRWLGHLGRMDDHRLPKKILFGWLHQRPPCTWDQNEMARSCQKRFEKV